MKKWITSIRQAWAEEIGDKPLPMKIAFIAFTVDSLVCTVIMLLTPLYGVDWFGAVSIWPGLVGIALALALMIMFGYWQERSRRK